MIRVACNKIIKVDHLHHLDDLLPGLWPGGHGLDGHGLAQVIDVLGLVLVNLKGSVVCIFLKSTATHLSHVKFSTQY